MRGVRLTGLGGGRLQVSSAAVLTHGNRRRAGKHGAWVMQDRVALNGRGGVTLLGRRGTTVKIAGRRVDLAEVSGRLLRLPGVRDAWTGVSAGTEPVLGPSWRPNGQPPSCEQPCSPILPRGRSRRN